VGVRFEISRQEFQGACRRPNTFGEHSVGNLRCRPRAVDRLLHYESCGPYPIHSLAERRQNTPIHQSGNQQLIQMRQRARHLLDLRVELIRVRPLGIGEIVHSNRHRISSRLESRAPRWFT
jgi:hypothetical protein